MFRMGNRSVLAAGDARPLRAVEPADALKQLSAWGIQAWTALASLHDADLVHGNITAAGSLFSNSADGRFQLAIHPSSLHPTTATGAATAFDAHTLNTPPEVHLRNGRSQGIPFASMSSALTNENWPIDRIRSVFPELDYSRAQLFKIYEALDAIGPMDQAADVWMLGYALLEVYLELLTWPYVLSSEFYRTKHEVWMDCLEHALAADPRERWTAAQIAEALRGSAVANSTANSAANSAVNSAATSENVENASVVVETVAPAAQAVEEPKRYRRLILNAPPRSAGRNKTRKNSRN